MKPKKAAKKISPDMHTDAQAERALQPKQVSSLR